VAQREVVSARPDLFRPAPPTVNAHGPLFGSAEYSTDVIPILDLQTHTVSEFVAPVRDSDTP
jgi:hypothetical protein